MQTTSLQEKCKEFGLTHWVVVEDWLCHVNHVFRTFSGRSASGAMLTIMLSKHKLAILISTVRMIRNWLFRQRQLSTELVQEILGLLDELQDVQARLGLNMDINVILRTSLACSYKCDGRLALRLRSCCCASQDTKQITESFTNAFDSCSKLQFDECAYRQQEVLLPHMSKVSKHSVPQ